MVPFGFPEVEGLEKAAKGLVLRMGKIARAGLEER
jgi:hypothetical protein